ncbi:PhzF family phenazine biosynthesis protein [Azotosporobacter soli]|uniref:PhzF family phenazine biosynthesis protein n=1 Tax=Azotosporobacter soli TaxID=3055040 RepID=UPI0031FE54CE
MLEFAFKKMDAFTTGLSSGNPAGYVDLDTAPLPSAEVMQKIAAELKGFVNEVGYVSRQKEQLTLRFYSSECEVAFCGHATIAIMYDLLKNSPELQSESEVFITVQAGTLSVFNRIQEENAVYIMAPPPAFLERQLSPSAIAEALGVGQDSLDAQMSCQVVDGGLRTLIVPLRTLEDCLALQPNQERLRLFCLANDFDIVHVSSRETVSSAHQYRTRVFAPKYGYLEDPATGSGNSAFCYYLIKNGVWQNDFSVEQGPSRNNPNIVKLKRYAKDGEARVLFGGCATTRIDGKYCLHAFG